jgi:hypothetical protein
VYLTVAKIVSPLTDTDNPLVRTTYYSYNAALRGVGTIFRYDSPDSEPREGAPEHHWHHHVHRYDVLAGDMDGWVEIIYDEDEVPTLGEVIYEAVDWFYANADAALKAIVRDQPGK